VPLLYEVGGDARFDVVVVVTAPEDVRLGRRTAPRDDREQRLIPDEEKMRRADFAFVNDGSLEELDAFVASVVESLNARV
jgi:dephospho-CoA kinase